MSDNETADEERRVASITERTRARAAKRAAEIGRGRTVPQATAPDDAANVFADTAAESEEDIPAIHFLRSVPPPPARARSAASGGSFRGRGGALFVFMVLVPLAIVAFYLYAVATPLYEARAVIAITRSSDAEASSQTGLLGSMDDSANLQEAFRADTYINSQSLMDALEAELGLVTEFSGPAIDPVRRLRPLPGLSVSIHDQFDRFVESSIDVRSGLMTLYVRAPSRARAIEISEAVLRKAENQVSQLGQTLFDTRQSYAAQMRADAEAQVQQAQARLVELQFRHQEVDPRTRIENIYGRIRELEDEAQRLDNEIQKAEIAGFGDNPQTAKLVALQEHIRDEVAREREQLVTPDGSSATPLNNLLMDYEMALLEVELARESVKTAIEAEAEAGREAALNRSILQVVVPPTTAGTAIYPKAPGILTLWLVISLAAFAAVMGFRKSRG